MPFRSIPFSIFCSHHLLRNAESTAIFIIHAADLAWIGAWVLVTGTDDVLAGSGPFWTCQLSYTYTKQIDLYMNSVLHLHIQYNVKYLYTISSGQAHHQNTCNDQSKNQPHFELIWRMALLTEEIVAAGAVGGVIENKWSQLSRKRFYI